MAVKRVFILGNHIQALGIARQVKQLNIPVFLFTSDSFSISRFSNAVQKTIFFKDLNSLQIKLDEAYDGEKNALLFPTNDGMVNFLFSNKKLLGSKFYIGLPEDQIVRTFYDKKNTHEFAVNNGLPAPETYFPVQYADIVNLADKISYPTVLKPSVMHTFHKTFGKKAFKCRNKEELLLKAKEIAAKFPLNEVMIQEFLDGGPPCLYSYGTFAVNGKPVSSVIVNRLRQNPMTFGNSTTFAKTCYVAEIQSLAEKILYQTNYTGVAEIEFMYDKKTNQYKLLEINTRTWKWHSISNALGFSFINNVINDINKEPLNYNNSFDKSVAWVERLTDTIVSLKEMGKGRMQLSAFLKTYKTEKEYAVWNPKDKIPFFMYIILAPILFFKR